MKIGVDVYINNVYLDITFKTSRVSFSLDRETRKIDARASQMNLSEEEIEFSDCYEISPPAAKLDGLI